MKILPNRSKQSGLTLVEVLAALVIMGIVFIGIMTVFPQMTLFNAKTETKLDTMNIARQEMAEFIENSKGKLTLVPDSDTNPSVPEYLTIPIDQIESVIELQFPGATISKTRVVTDDTTSNKDDYTSFIFNSTVNAGQEFKFEIQVFDVPDLAGTISLYKTILKIYTLQGQLSSETYGYIEVSP
ncbi:type II secretion system GspH family protein [Paenisporosarcina quisquiliarum]|uniref:Type II secretion system GspH family protein n=1 Tax=Paenisporosarcina quisquiliarum TaxID=365346 RepID=A0A9X3LGW7_9BACL|nr:type II secretion system protein [Paenisporosarcina quisquiliarum]MCZ8536184.1 type II secretion system GspH family protein [Paenisporosarcina quisquiliarum]